MDQIQTENVIIIGDVSVDLCQRVVTISDQLIHFTRKEFDMLSFLARHPGWAFTKEQLLDAAWGGAEANYDQFDRAVKIVCVLYMRKPSFRPEGGFSL